MLLKIPGWGFPWFAGVLGGPGGDLRTPGKISLGDPV